MESDGSNDSFAWTNASNDISDFDDDISSNFNMKEEKSSDHELTNNSDNVQEKKKSKKAKKRKASSDESNAEYPIKKRIKTEPESDSTEKKVKKELELNESLKSTKKKKKHQTESESFDLEETVVKSEINGNGNLDENSDIEENIKPKKEKKKKRQKEAVTFDLEESVIKSEEIDVNNEIEERVKPKKEKRKKQKQTQEERETESTLGLDDSVTENGFENDNIIEEKITVEEIVITKSGSNHVVEVLVDKHKKKKKKNKKKQKEDEVNDSHSDSVDISAIVNDVTEIDHTDNEMPEESFRQKEDWDTENKSKSNRRVTERLLFEDDSNVMDISTHNDSNVKDSSDIKMSKRMDLYMKNNKNLQILKPNIDPKAIISKYDDEVWLLRCPREIDVKQLKGVILNEDSKSKIKISGKNYDAILDEDDLQLPIMTYINNKPIIQNFKLNGCINIKRRLPKPHVHNSEIMVDNVTDFIPLPETKCRHPLFGINYKKAIKVPAQVAERLKADNPVEVEEEVKKKKKKHKKEKRQLETEVEEQESVKFEEPVSKKKKRKHSQVEESPVKAKRIKHDPTSETWESEKAIEETLFDF